MSSPPPPKKPSLPANFLQALSSKKESLNPQTTIHTTTGGMRYTINEDGQRVIIGERPGFVVDTRPDPHAAQIIPNLFIGSQDPAANFEELKAKGITAIVNCAPQVVHNHFADIEEPKMYYKTLPLLDLPTQSLKEVLGGAVDFIHKHREAGHGVLVHCNAGVSRSTSVCIAYLVLYLGHDYKTALQMCRDVRNRCNPNDGFAAQLKQLVPGNRAKKTAAAAAAGSGSSSSGKK